MRTLAASLVLLIVVAGCAGGGDAPPTSTVAGSEAATGDGVGAVSGIVTDDERRPLVDAEIKLTPGERIERTTAEGRFVFSKVPVGNYVLNASANGHHTREMQVNVSEARTSALVVVLIPLPTDLSYYVTFSYSGLQQCMVYTAVYLASCSQPYTAAYITAHNNGVNGSSAGAPEDVLQNRYRYNFTATPDHTGIVSELVWNAVSEGSRYYVLQLSCPFYDPVVDDCLAPGETTVSPDTTYARARGVSPLRIEWDAHQWEDWGPWIMSRAYLSGPVDRPAGAALDQRIDMYNTVFYGADVPNDWTILADPTTTG